MASKLFKKNNELKYEDFEPTHELQESPENYVFLVNIPGFRKEDFKVQVDFSGKLSVKGQRIADNKCRQFSKIIQLPADSNIEKIRGKFEADVLTLTVSRKEKKALPPIEEVKSSAEANLREEAKASDQEKEKESKPEESSSEKKEEESKPKEEPKQTTNNKEEEPKPEETETDKKITEEPEADAEKKEESTKPKEETETKKPASLITDAKNDNPIMKNPAGRKIAGWKERIRQEAKGWSDHATLDNILDVISRNKKEIAVAVAAISIGFIIVRRLNAGK